MTWWISAARPRRPASSRRPLISKGRWGQPPRFGSLEVRAFAQDNFRQSVISTGASLRAQWRDPEELRMTSPVVPRGPRLRSAPLGMTLCSKTETAFGPGVLYAASGFRRWLASESFDCFPGASATNPAAVLARRDRSSADPGTVDRGADRFVDDGKAAGRIRCIRFDAAPARKRGRECPLGRH